MTMDGVKALQEAALRGQIIGVERPPALGSCRIVAQENTLAVGHPLSGQDDLPGQDPRLVQNLGPSLAFLGHGLPQEDDAQKGHDNVAIMAATNLICGGRNRNVQRPPCLDA